MAKVFVSYSRKDITFAKRLTAELQKCELDFWIDWEGIPPTVDWWREIEKGIEEADIFLFLISPDSARSKVCVQEIETAVKNSKRIIPIVVRAIDWKDTPSHLGHLNYIFFRENDDFDAAANKLITAIQTDYAWAATHRRLQVKALDWERNNKDGGFLLRGADLLDAEQDLAMNTSKEPHPTDLQREYVFESRKATDRQRRTTTSFAIGGVVVLSVLSVVAVVMAVRATQQARIARAGELAAQSIEVRDRDFQISLLLGIEGFRSANTVQSRGALLDVTNTSPIIQFITIPENEGEILAFTPDGMTFASAKEDRSIILWDTVSRRRRSNPLNGHKGKISTLTISPDGLTLASAACTNPESEQSCRISEIIIWDLHTLQPTEQPFITTQGEIQVLAFSPDGRILVSLGRNIVQNTSEIDNPSIILWDIVSRKPIGHPITPEGNAKSVAFSPDSKTLAIGESNHTFTIWDVTTQQPIGRPSVGGGDHIIFSHDGNSIISNIPEIGFTIWDLSTQQERHPDIDRLYSENMHGISNIALSPDGKILATSRLILSGVGKDRGEIILWDIESLMPVGQPLGAHTDRINSMSFSEDGKTLISISDDNTSIFWNMSIAIDQNHTTLQPISRYLTPYGDLVSDSEYSPTSQIAFSPDGKTLASNGAKNTISIWNVESTNESNPKTMKGQLFVFNKDGKKLITMSDNEISLWDMLKQKSLDYPIGKSASGITLSPDGKTLISFNDYSDEILFWDIGSNQPRGRPFLGHTRNMEITSIVLSSDGKILATGTSDSKIVFWDVTTNQKITPILNHGGGTITRLSISSDGRILASGTGTSIILWDVKKSEWMGQFNGADFALSHDGKTIATIIAQNHITHSMILWDVETQQPIGQPLIQPLSETSFRIIDLAFSPDGNTLATMSDYGAIILWDLDPESWIEKSCRRVGRNLTRVEWEKYGFTETYRKTCEQWPLASEALLTPTP